MQMLFAVLLAAFSVEQIFEPFRNVRTNESAVPMSAIDDADWIWAKDARVWGEESRNVGNRPTDGSPWYKQQYWRLRCPFGKADGELKFHVSADERFVLFLDGKEIARGPHRGMVEHWNCQSYAVTDLEDGPHLMEAVVWQVGPTAPRAQLSWRGGFVFKADGAYDGALTTGKAKWTAAKIRGTKVGSKGECFAWAVGGECEVVGTSILDPSAADAYGPTEVVRAKPDYNQWLLPMPGWKLFPTGIKDQMYERRMPGEFKAARAGGSPTVAWREEDAADERRVRLNALLASGKSLVVNPGERYEAIWDLGNYYCGYPELRTKGGKGARVVWKWTESLIDAKNHKADRAAFAGKRVVGAFGDTFVSDGREGASFTTPWWRCGRWCRLEIAGGETPLEITSLAINETRYPWKDKSRFECDDSSVVDIRRICKRALEMCMHEMFFDCPYYEQHMYPADSRVQALALGVLCPDRRLIRQSVTLFDETRHPNGMVAMCHPTRLTMESCTYSMHWIYWLRDCLYWGDVADREWLKARLGCMRGILSGLEIFERPDGTLGELPGWSFSDYTPDWFNGVAPKDSDGGQGAMVNLQYLYALQMAVDLEEKIGDKDFAFAWKRRADKLAAAIRVRYWDEERGMLADSVGRESFSEQVQSLAVLTDVVKCGRLERMVKNLKEAKDMTRATVYFSHYLFEAYFKAGIGEEYFPRLGLWKEYVRLNMSTLQEMPPRGEKDPRSDCHAWGASPLYHFATHVAGIEPVEPFWGKVRIAPNPGPYKFVRAVMPTHRGYIEVDFKFGENGHVCGKVMLPNGLEGEFLWHGKRLELHDGENRLE